MSTRRAALTFGLQTALLASAGVGQFNAAQAQGTSDQLQAKPPSAAALRTPRLVGQQRFTYWGFEVYDASLWASAPFVAEDWAKQVLVLELRYLRDFKGADIAQRSMDEMQGQRPLNSTQQSSWSTTLQSLIPNVRAGERITGIYSPDKGMQLLHQDRVLGELRDPEFAQRFLGIWLAPETSQRKLRQQLLAGAQP
jgi:Chalcone isomerase-like